jgi:hypothetical protein
MLTLYLRGSMRSVPNPNPVPLNNPTAPSAAVGYLSPEEAARFLSISKRELERYRTAGGGPVFHKLGRRTIRYSVKELCAWMDRFKYANTADAASRQEVFNV